MLNNFSNLNSQIKKSDLEQISKLAKALREEYLASAKANGYQVAEQKQEHLQKLHNNAQLVVENPEAAITGSGLDLDKNPMLPDSYFNGMQPSHYNQDFIKQLYPDSENELSDGISRDALRSKLTNKAKNKLKMSIDKPAPKPKINYTIKPSAPPSRPPRLTPGG